MPDRYDAAVDQGDVDDVVVVPGLCHRHDVVDVDLARARLGIFAHDADDLSERNVVHARAPIGGGAARRRASRDWVLVAVSNSVIICSTTSTPHSWCSRTSYLARWAWTMRLSSSRTSAIVSASPMARISLSRSGLTRHTSMPARRAAA